MVLFLLAIAFSRFGRIPLGLDGEKPEYSTISWAAMLFGAGIGIGIIFFGPLEPLTYYVSPLPGLYEPGTVAAVRHGIVEHGDHFELAVAETAPRRRRARRLRLDRRGRHELVHPHRRGGQPRRVRLRHRHVPRRPPGRRGQRRQEAVIPGAGQARRHRGVFSSR